MLTMLYIYMHPKTIRLHSMWPRQDQRLDSHGVDSRRDFLTTCTLPMKQDAHRTPSVESSIENRWSSVRDTVLEPELSRALN